MTKWKQVFMLITGLAVLAAVAFRRDGKLLGHDFRATSQQVQTSKNLNDTLKVLKDGTLLINTTALGKAIIGYGGTVPLKIYLKDNKVDRVEALPNKETPDFFSEASSLLDQWNGKTIDEALALKVDGVSGATFSSRAIIGNVQAGLRYAAQNAEKPSLSEKIDLSAKNIAGIIVVLMAAIVPLFYKKKRYRMVQMVLNIGILGFWCGTFLSYSLFVGYMSNGIHVLTSLIAVIMLVMAFVYPLFGKKNYYCVNVCPYGALQELAGKTKIKKWKLSARTVAYLTTFRKVLWGLLMAMMLAGVGFEWMDYEVFSAFIMTSASVVVLCMAVVFFILSLFVPRPYCRFVCPTGTLFKITQNSK